MLSAYLAMEKFSPGKMALTGGEKEENNNED
jgi:hypothetical protein